MVLYVIYLFYRDYSLTSYSLTMQTEQLHKCFLTTAVAEGEVGSRLAGLRHPPPNNVYMTDCSKAILLIWFSEFACFGVSFLLFSHSLCLVDFYFGLGS